MGYLAGFWTIPLLLVHLFNQFSLALSQTTVRNILYELGYRCRRPRLAASKIDDLASSKMSVINEAFNSLNNNSVILYQDETTCRLLPVIRRMWMRLNEQVRIITPSGWNRRFSVFGALNAKSGKFSYAFFDRAISASFITFMEHLLKEYPNKAIFLILDSATYHTSHMVQDWSQNHPEIKFLWLPKNNPQLNPVEKIWWRMKGIIAANNSYKGLKIMKQKCIEFFTNLTPEAAIKLTSLAA